MEYVITGLSKDTDYKTRSVIAGPFPKSLGELVLKGLMQLSLHKKLKLEEKS